jgi:hypothetical protein
MLDETTIRSVAARVEQARKTHELMRPVTAPFPEATIEDAYAIQRAWVALRLAEGHRVLGHKIGLTSKAMQSQSSVKEPDYGCLLDDTMFADPRTRRSCSAALSSASSRRAPATRSTPISAPTARSPVILIKNRWPASSEHLFTSPRLRGEVGSCARLLGEGQVLQMVVVSLRRQEGAPHPSPLPASGAREKKL